MTNESSNPAIRLRNVSKTFGRGAAAVEAVRAVDLTCDAGQLIMLAGPSGCGKTTLISIIGGLLAPSSGEVELCGVNWQRLSQRQRTRRRAELVGYIFQQYRLIPTLTVELNVAVALLPHGVAYREAISRSVGALELVGLAGRRHAKPAELSGGMQQRVAIARALVGQPRVLVCDEPTANLDRETGRDVIQLIENIARTPDDQGLPRTVLVVTHDYRVLRHADVIYQMEDGRLDSASADLMARIEKERHASVSAISLPDLDSRKV
jgi:putative ABC transport system ATP-binding protein